MSGYLGLVSLSSTLAFTLQCRNGNNVVNSPDSTPSYAVYDTDGNRLLSGSFGASDHDSKTGYRRASISVTAGNGFAVGESFEIRKAWAVSSSNYAETDVFQVV